MASELKILVLISGRGSNLGSLIQHAENYSILGILSNNHKAPGLEYGVRHDIPVYPFSRSDFASLKDFKQAMFEQAAKLRPDLIALAGFMQIIQPEFVEAFYGKIINIHPALLPKFPGIDTHQRALAAGELIHGCTVHYLDSGVDTGPIIAQAAVPVQEGDGEQQLAARVLEREHKLYPWVVSRIALGDIKLDGREIIYSAGARAAAAQCSFTLNGEEPRLLRGI